MKLIILLLILGFVFSKTLPTVYDVWYNLAYSLDDIYSDEYNEYLFKAQVVPGTQMDFEILIQKADTYNFQFSIVAYEFTYEPTVDNIKNKDGYMVYPEAYKKTTDKDYKNYDVYAYHYTVNENVIYLGIYVSYEQIYYFPVDSIYFRLNVFKYSYSNIKDIKTNKDYEIDTEIFTGGLIPHNYQMYFRLEAEEKDSMEIVIETHESYDPKNAFEVHVCQYIGRPTDSQVYYAKLCGSPLENKSDESKKFSYQFDTDENIDYLAIEIVNKHTNLYYLYLTIYSLKGLAAGIIVLIILLPLLLIGGGAGFFVHRKRNREKI